MGIKKETYLSSLLVVTRQAVTTVTMVMVVTKVTT